MTSKLLKVFGTYTRRPMVWLLAVFVLLLAVVLWMQGFFPTSSVSIAPEIELTGDAAVVTVSQWDEYFREHAASDVASMSLTDLPTAEFPNLTPLENLTTLKLSTRDFTQKMLAEVRSLENLRALALQTSSVPDGTWRALGPKLRRLAVPVELLLAHPDEVSQLVELRMLRVNPQGMTAEALSVIAQIPNLEHLAIVHDLLNKFGRQGTSRPVVTRWELRSDNLRPLAGHPTLEAVFADWPPGTSRTNPALPGVRLYPAHSPSAWQVGIMLTFYMTVAIAVIVILQVWAQFVMPTAAVIPRYAGPHQLAALIVLAGGSLVGAAGLWWLEIAWIPGWAIALAVPTTILALFTTSQSPSRRVRNLGVPLIAVACVLFWWPLNTFLSLPPVMSGELTWFLRGEFDVISVLILLAESTLLGIVFVKMPQLTSRVNETSSLQPGVSPWGRQQQRRINYSSKSWRMRLWDRAANFGHLGGESIWQKARLWRAGNAYRPWTIMMFAPLFIVIFAGMGMLTSGEGRLADPGIWIAGLAQLGLITLMLPPFSWHQRAGCLQVASLRPVRRKDFVRQLFLALILDQSLAIVPFAIALAIALLFPLPGISQAGSYGFFALGLAALAWAYAISTAVFAVKRKWILLGLFIAMFMLPIMSFSTLVIVLEGPELQVVQIVNGSLMVSVLAVAILAAFYRRALRREWG